MYPVWWAEINSFGQIVALVEASMVGTWKSYHDITGTLIRPNNLYQTQNYYHTMVPLYH